MSQFESAPGRQMPLVRRPRSRKPFGAGRPVGIAEIEHDHVVENVEGGCVTHGGGISRAIVLVVIADRNRRGPGHFQQAVALNEAGHFRALADDRTNKHAACRGLRQSNYFAVAAAGSEHHINAARSNQVDIPQRHSDRVTNGIFCLIKADLTRGSGGQIEGRHNDRRIGVAAVIRTVAHSAAGESLPDQVLISPSIERYVGSQDGVATFQEGGISRLNLQRFHH